MTDVLVAYATRHGSTREVAESVARTLRAEGLTVDVLPAALVVDLDAYEAVVLGSAIYMGRLHKDARTLLGALGGRRVAVFAMGPLTASPEDIAGAQRELAGALVKFPRVRPFALAAFGGVVQPEKLRFPFSRMKASDARDWNAIDAWAKEVAAELVPSAV